MDFFVKHKLTLIGVVIGAVVGYLYYHYIGCASGTCSITSQPINSAAYGAAMGGLILNMFQNKKEPSPLDARFKEKTYKILGIIGDMEQTFVKLNKKI